MDKYTLNNNVQIPQVGMGTWPLRGTELEQIMQDALDVGYRLFDTADNYSNEEFIGNVVSRNSDIRRDIFLMTKISDEKSSLVNAPWSSIGKYFYKTSSYMQNHTAKDVVDMLVENSLHKLQADYIDSLILHWPYPDYLLEIWEEMINLYKCGVLKSIGVSNCRERHLKLLKSCFDIKPMVNQISISPIDTKQSLVDYCNKNDIQLVCYAPLMMMNNPKVTNSEIIKLLLSKYNTTLGQLILSWNYHKGIIPIPKSTKKSRLIQNLKVDKISLTLEDIELIDSLNEDIQYLPESTYCPGI